MNAGGSSQLWRNRVIPRRVLVIVFIIVVDFVGGLNELVMLQNYRDTNGSHLPSSGLPTPLPPLNFPVENQKLHVPFEKEGVAWECLGVGEARFALTLVISGNLDAMILNNS